jgi:TIR domain-containing protein
MATESDVFISYATDTKPLAEQLAQALQAQGFYAWVDFNLRPGQVWQDEVERALERARSFLIVVSPRSRASSWQEAEWRAVLAKVWSDSDKRLIPIVVGGSEPPPFLRNWVGLRVDPAAEPANWTRHVVDALRSAQNEAVHVPSAEYRRERQQRLDEISRAAEQLGKNEPEHGDLPPGSKR